MKRKVQKYLASRGYADTPGDDHRFDLHGEVEGSKRERNSQLQSFISRLFSTRFG